MREVRHVPDDLLSDILSKLPARSVIRFRCVCKLWQSITQDGCFIDAHLDHARKSNPPSILLFFSVQCCDVYGIAVIDRNSRWTPKPSSWVAAVGQVFLGNSCNGLVCIYGKIRIQVINPATGESLTLPENTETGAKHSLGTYVGFHPGTKEYKVICFFALDNDRLELIQVGCEVYTLGTDNWRRISIPDHYPFPWCLPAPAIVKGAAYWLIWNMEVLSFDLKSEMFAHISFPDSKIYNEEDYMIHDLIELQGSVCLTITIYKDGASQPLDIWMLTVNIDESNNTKYEWALKYSVLLPIGHGFRSTLLIHNEKILVHKSVWNGYDSDNEDESAELIYYHLNSKGQGREVFYREGETISPRIYDYLKGEYGEDGDLFHDWRIHCFQPFVHINSLVSLGSK